MAGKEILRSHSKDINQNRKLPRRKSPVGSTSSDSGSTGTGSESLWSFATRHRKGITSPDIEDINFDQGFGYDVSSYLTGKEQLDKLLGLWHIFVLVSTFCVIVFVFGVRFLFGSYIDFHLSGLPSYKVYLKFIKSPVSSHDYHFYSLTNEMCNIFLVANVMYIWCTVVYVTYFAHRNQFTLPCIALITSVVFIGEGVMVNIMYSPGVLRDYRTMQYLQRRLKEEYSVSGQNELSIVQDHISIWLQCCGIVDVHDFRNVSLRLQSKEVVQTPPSCCKGHVFKAGPEAVKACTKKGHEESIFYGGCIEPYLAWIQTLCRRYAVFSWIHLVDCVVHAWLYRSKIALNNHVVNVYFP